MNFRGAQRGVRMHSRFIQISLIVTLGTGFGPSPLCFGQPAAEAKDAPAPAIQINAFASADYTHNFNGPDSGLNAFRVFDGEDRTAALSVVELAVQKAAVKAWDLGFRADVVAGRSVPKVEAASGLFRDPDSGEAHNYDLQQAFASLVLPLGSGLKLDAGKFTTPLGYEVIEGYDGYNDNASRSFLFGYAIPFTHTGLRFAYAFSDHFSGQMLLVEGWDNDRDNNSAFSEGVQLAWTPGTALTLAFAAMVGPEQKDNNRNNREIYDLTAVWKAAPRLSFGLNADYGHETAALGPGRDAIWNGAALYAAYKFSDEFSLALRAERFDDRDGARTGTAQSLKEITVTPAYAFGKHVVVRGDLRLDTSDRSVFQKNGGMVRRQPTASLNILYIY
jgi:hypothetical protein